MDTIEYSAQPTFALYADSKDGFARWRDAVAAIGGRLLLPATRIAGAVELLDAMPDPDVVLVDVREDGGEALDRLLDRLNLAAADGRHASVVALTPELIDVTAARAPHGDVVLLCAPTPVECAAAISLAVAARPHILLRERGEEPPMQLRRLSEEVGRIARALAELSGGEAVATAALPMKHPVMIRSDMPTISALRTTIRARRLREQFFESDLFADPAWDMLLDLLLARVEGRSVAVSSLCIAASVPPTTALRWIKRLTDEGIFERTADPRDGRRVFIDLAPQAVDAMAAYFRALDRTGVTFP